MKKMVFTFGRFNPPTTGHLLLANKVKAEARSRGAEHKIYGSGTQDKKKNPLSPTDKFLFMKKVLKGFDVVVNKKYSTIFSILQKNKNTIGIKSKQSSNDENEKKNN